MNLIKVEWIRHGIKKITKQEYEEMRTASIRIIHDGWKEPGEVLLKDVIGCSPCKDFNGSFFTHGSGHENERYLRTHFFPYLEGLRTGETGKVVIRQDDVRVKFLEGFDIRLFILDKLRI